MFDSTWKVIAKDLEGLSHRYRAVGQNLANSNTPGYARREVSFEDQLKDVIDGSDRLTLSITNDKHIKTGSETASEVIPREGRVQDQLYRLDRNNVNPEIEIARLSETRMGYEAMTQLMAKKVSVYKMAIGGR